MKKTDAARQLLEPLLAAGPMPANQAQALAAEAGLSKRTIDRARAELRVRTRKAKGAGGAWVWSLPRTRTSAHSSSAVALTPSVAPGLQTPRPDTAVPAVEATPAKAPSQATLEPEPLRPAARSSALQARPKRTRSKSRRRYSSRPWRRATSRLKASRAAPVPPWPKAPALARPRTLCQSRPGLRYSSSGTGIASRRIRELTSRCGPFR